MQINESIDITRARSEGESAVKSDRAKKRLSIRSPFLEVQANPGQAMSPAVAAESQESAAGYSMGAMTLDRWPAHNSVVGAEEEVAVLEEQTNQSVSDCKLPVQTGMITGTAVIFNSAMEEDSVVGCA